MKEDRFVKDALTYAINLAKENASQFVCPEHILLGLITQVPFHNALVDVGINVDNLSSALDNYLSSMEKVPEDIEYDLEGSAHLNIIMNDAYHKALNGNAPEITVPHVVKAMMDLEDCSAGQLLKNNIQCSEADFLSVVIDAYMDAENAGDEMLADAEPVWRRYVTAMNPLLESRNPLIGRNDELERAVQVLCRRDKNNVLFVGESGVGKTALAWGLVSKINSGEVPDRLKFLNAYQLDMARLVAGAQFRGELEKRLREVLDGISEEGSAIVFIDELQSLIGTSQGDDGGSDALQLLVPYMEGDVIRFISTCSYQEQNKYASRLKGLMRRFQSIDVPEPDKNEAILILEGLRASYEDYHNVKYGDDVIEYVVDMSIRHITNRCLPDKALDVLDEAGALCETMKSKRRKSVSKKIINSVVQKIAKVKAEALSEDGNANIATLKKRITSLIYGQDEAVASVVRSVEMAKAGLTDEDKPLASLLFVGPTGVGKTEVARVLASELGVDLVRFDMSEYTEKHTVAKLIGSPAGYVGYEDGGLLTDAIRKSPNCVLLLDEIEKAHPDIYNILLQVMDYARLTDNRGNKADFRNVILIMTSNAGAQFASQASLGFGGGISSGEAMLAQVKKNFKPEFLNRLSGTVVFHDMDMPMASLILNKKLAQMQEKLSRRNVTLRLSDEARALLLKKGFTRQYGAREMDRILQQMLSPLLIKEILYGSLQKGGNAEIKVNDGELIIHKS